MFRVNTPSGRDFIAGVVFFVLIICGSVLYYLHVRRTSETETRHSEQFLLELQTENNTSRETSTILPVEIETSGVVSTPAGDMDTPVSDETETFPDETDSLDLSDAFLPDDFVLEETQVSEDVPVSPHGFGAYPEVPTDFPEDVNWSDYEDDLPIYELMTRVQIRLWEQGQRAVGISEENGLMYPIIRGTVYIRWNRAGTEVIEVTGHPSDMSDAAVDQIEAGITPPGLTVLDYETDGIDPYEFLNLQ